MKLNGKKDVRRLDRNANKSKKSRQLFSLNFKKSHRSKDRFGIQKRKDSASLEKNKASTKGAEVFQKHRSKQYGLSRYNDGEGFSLKGVFSFLIILSIILTGSTVFYFHQMSSKLVLKKELIMQLYHKYRSIRFLNEQTRNFLKTLEKNQKISGELYMLVDKDQLLEQETTQAYQRYLSQSNEENSDVKLYRFSSFLCALGIFIFFVSFRVYLLFKERRTPLYVQKEDYEEHFSYPKL